MNNNNTPSGAQPGKVLVVCDEEERVLPFSIGDGRESASELAQRLAETLTKYGTNKSLQPVALQDMTTQRMIPLSTVARNPSQVPDNTGYRVICVPDSDIHQSMASDKDMRRKETYQSTSVVPPPTVATRPPTAAHEQRRSSDFARGGMQPDTEIVWDYFSPRKEETKTMTRNKEDGKQARSRVSEKEIAALRSLVLDSTLTLSEASAIWADITSCQIITGSAVDTQALLSSYSAGDISFQELAKELLRHHRKKSPPSPDSQRRQIERQRQMTNGIYTNKFSATETAENVVRLAYIVQELHQEGVRVVSRDQLLDMGVLDDHELAVLDQMVEEAHPDVVRAFEETLEDLSSHGLALRLVAVAKSNSKMLDCRKGVSASRPSAPTPNEGLAMRLLEDLQLRDDISAAEGEFAQELMDEEDRDMTHLVETVESEQSTMDEVALRDRFLSGLRSVIRNKLRANEGSDRSDIFFQSLLRAATALYDEKYISLEQFTAAKEEISQQNEDLVKMYLEAAQTGDNSALFNTVLRAVSPEVNKDNAKEDSVGEADNYETSVFFNDVVEELRYQGQISGSDSTVLRHLWTDGDLMVQAACCAYRHNNNIEELKDTLLVILEREKMQLVESHDHSIHVVEGLRSLHCLTEDEAQALKAIVEHDRESQSSPQASPNEETGGRSPSSVNGGPRYQTYRERAGSATTDYSIGVRTKAANEVAAAIEQYLQDRDVAELVSRLKAAANNRSTVRLDRQPSLSSVGPTMEGPEITEHNAPEGLCQQFAELEAHHPENVIDHESQSKLLALVSELFHHDLCSSAEASALSRLVNAQDERLLAMLESHHRLSETQSIDALEELAHSLRTLGDLIEEPPREIEQMQEVTHVKEPPKGSADRREPRAVNCVNNKHQYLLQLFLSQSRKALQQFSSEESEMLMELVRHKNRYMEACIEGFELDDDEENLIDSLKRLLKYQVIQDHE
eukprot:gb/GECG01002551.1/.p1 GENE.gb/GECG01002551.1/~~gb/GECG01002551.1/.p1  ORF type:complete len:965 (+),score=166.50 gb/GECG01002551.1/:1-2895(+)